MTLPDFASIEMRVIAHLIAARDLMDAQPVPTEGRLVWPHSFREPAVTLTLTYDELCLLDTEMRRVHLKKLDAFETCTQDFPSTKFTARDFGLPTIESIITKIQEAT